MRPPPKPVAALATFISRAALCVEFRNAFSKNFDEYYKSYYARKAIEPYKSKLRELLAKESVQNTFQLVNETFRDEDLRCGVCLPPPFHHKPWNYWIASVASVVVLVCSALLVASMPSRALSLGPPVQVVLGLVNGVAGAVLFVNAVRYQGV